MSRPQRHNCAPGLLHVLRVLHALCNKFDLLIRPCRFVRNIGAICTYAFAGTFVSTVAIAFIM